MTINSSGNEACASCGGSCPAPPPPAGCSVDEDCDGDLVCDGSGDCIEDPGCSTNADCDGDLVCDGSGDCVEDPGCSTTADCDGDLICDGAGDCVEDPGCVTNADCDGDLVCDGAGNCIGAHRSTCRDSAPLCCSHACEWVCAVRMSGSYCRALLITYVHPYAYHRCMSHHASHPVSLACSNSPSWPSRSGCRVPVVTHIFPYHEGI